MNSDGHSKKTGNHAVPVITLLTDFGLEDGYVAGMKGVILSICPRACLVDISHLIPPQGIRSGAFVLTSAYRCFPKGAVHLAVVDPGVGTARKALVLKTEDYSFVGPDNGLFSWIVQDESALGVSQSGKPRVLAARRQPDFPRARHFCAGCRSSRKRSSSVILWDLPCNPNWRIGRLSVETHQGFTARSSTWTVSAMP